jgi:S1-C subfamily serine protease
MFALEGSESRKWLLIDENTDPPLRPGTYYVTVADAYQTELGVGFSVLASLSREAPESVLQRPRLNAATNRLEERLRAATELISADGGGTGTLVTPDGLILTNYHVVEKLDGNLVEDGAIIVSLTLDVHLPPVDLYRARVLESDKSLDLALLEIRSHFYGQPLGREEMLPWMPLAGDIEVQIGDPLSVIGFPWIGGAGGRVTTTMTRGIVAGFEREGNATLIKTDAGIHSGNSGGPVLNQKLELVGIASQTIEEEAGKLGYVRPISLVPAAWRKQIAERIERAGQSAGEKANAGAP